MKRFVCSQKKIIVSFQQMLDKHIYQYYFVTFRRSQIGSFRKQALLCLYLPIKHRNEEVSGNEKSFFIILLCITIWEMVRFATHMEMNHFEANQRWKRANFEKQNSDLKLKLTTEIVLFNQNLMLAVFYFMCSILYSNTRSTQMYTNDSIGS